MNVKTNPLRRAGVGLATLGVLLGTVALAGPAFASNVADLGGDTVIYRGPRIQVVVSFPYARYHPYGKWLILDTEMGASGGVTGIPRGAFAVRTPGGNVVPLATEAQFVKGYPELASPLITANFERERLAYLLPERHRKLDLFQLHGVGWVWQTVWLDPFHNSYGRLFFELPNGVRQGRYELLIHLPKKEVVIPFTV